MSRNADSRRRSPKLQISLRLLLVLFTAFAIGFPIWYRWPYEQVENLGRPPRQSEVQRLTTWRRSWGGGRRKHGVERMSVGGLVEEITYHDGIAHGPRRRWTKGKEDQPLVSGMMMNGKMHGTWTYSNSTQITFSQGLEHGPCVIGDSQQTKHRLLFHHGTLTHIGKDVVIDRLNALLKAGHIDNKRIAEEVKRETNAEFFEFPITEAMGFMAAMHEVPIVVDRQAVDPQIPVTLDCKGLDLSHILTLLTHVHGLSTDYRYGCLWITSPESAEKRHDPTGITEMVPPPASHLAAVWNEPINLVVKQVPLEQVLAAIAKQGPIEIDTARLSPASSQQLVTIGLERHPLRHALGATLALTGCRCELQGERLVVFPGAGGAKPLPSSP